MFLAPGSVGRIGDPHAPNQGGGSLGPLSPSLKKLQEGSGDVNWAVFGDSTGAGDVQYFKPLLTSLAPRFPATTFIYYPPDASGGYGTPVTIQTGSGSHTLRLYNASVSGTNIEYFMVDKYQGAFIDPGRSWDAIWCNDGKNLANGGTVANIEGEFAGAILQLMIDFPASQYVLIEQYPNRDDTAMDLVSFCVRDLQAFASRIGIVPLKTGVTFSFADYRDNQHLEDAAYTSKANPFVFGWVMQQAPGDYAPEVAWNTIPAVNLLYGDGAQAYTDFSLDGDGAVAPGAANVVPLGLANVGTTAYSKELAITYRGAPRSQKMQGSGATFSRMGRGLTAAGVAAAKGKRCWLVSIVYIPAGAAGTVGRIQVSSNGTGAISETSRSSSMRGAWRIRAHGPFTMPADMTQANGFQYHDTAAAPDATHPLYVAGMGFTVSPTPRLPALVGV